MRIAFFADSYKPYLSGVTNSAEILVNELRAFDHKVYIFAPNYPNHIDTDADIFRFPSIVSGYKNFRLAIPFIRDVPAVDIIHSHSPFQAGLLASYLARKRKTAFVYSFHTLFTRYVHYAKFVPKELAKMGIVAYLRAFSTRADQLITPSTMAKRVLLKWGIKKPIAVIPAGVELHHLPQDHLSARQKLRDKYNIPAKAKVLLYIGRLSREKNIPFLLQAFARITEPNVFLVLVGGGPLGKSFSQHHDRRIILTGEVNYPDVLHHYLLGDIFIFASTTETQGLVLAEAKAAGLPIVALFAGGLIDSVRSGVDGYLVARRLDPFVDHLNRLLQDDALRSKMSRAARQDAGERFSSRVVAKQTESLYNFLSQEKKEQKHEN